MSQRYTPDPHEGGDFYLTLPALPQEVKSIHVKTTFLGFDAGGEEQIGPSYDEDLRLP